MLRGLFGIHSAVIRSGGNFVLRASAYRGGSGGRVVHGEIDRAVVHFTTQQIAFGLGFWGLKHSWGLGRIGDLGMSDRTIEFFPLGVVLRKQVRRERLV